MALSGLEIYKLLPKTNCRQCGFPTCLAFAMQLAKKAVSLDKCPFLTKEAKRALEESSLPAIRLITIGKGDSQIQIGNETVLFRHEEKFYHPAGIGIIIDDDLSNNEILERLQKIKKIDFERVGQRLKIELVAIRNKSSEERFLEVLDLVVKESSFALVLMSEDIKAIKKVLDLVKDLRPLIYKANSKNLSEFALLVKEYGFPLVVSGKTLDELSEITKELNQRQVNDLVLEVEEKNFKELLWKLTQIRRLSLKKKERSLGYPTLLIIEKLDRDLAVLFAVSFIAKYAGIILLDIYNPEELLGILTLRQNIYTDPQKPLQVEPKLYPVGTVNQNSPVLITTNFSLTYYTVLGEVEASRVGSYILSVNTEGMSVLTAWAAEKFTPETITQSIERSNLKEIVSHRSLIIPGYVAVMSGELEEKSGWQVIVGPKEASGIPAFLKNLNLGNQ
jgi:acetyl-CoA decarbonylase/synthase complex subunit gamma